MRFNLKFLLLFTLVCSLFVCFYLLPPEPLDNIENVTILEEREDWTSFRFEAEITRTGTDQVLNLLRVGGTVDFYDSSLTISDPGIYVTLKRLSKTEFAVHAGNHGWTQSYFRITAQEAYDYFWVCRNDNLVSKTEWPFSQMKLVYEGKQLEELDEDASDIEIYQHIKRLIKNEKANR